MKLLKNDIQMFATGEFEADVFYEYIGSPLIESVEVTIKCPAKLGTEIPSGWTKEDDYTLTKVYTEDSTQLVTLYLYPGSSSGSVINIDVNINVFGIGKINTRDQKFYAFGENKSKQEVYTKGDFVLLKKEFTEQNNKWINVLFTFPNNTWTPENTRIVECRVTHWNFRNNKFIRNSSYIVPMTNVLSNDNGQVLSLNTMYNVTLTPDGNDGFGNPCDILVSGYIMTPLENGDKKVVELLLMKVGVEE